MSDETPLYVRQAEGLRALADMIEANPDIDLDFALRHIGQPLNWRVQDPRQTLVTFHDASTAYGAEVNIHNGPDRCMVTAVFDAVRVQMWAAAANLAGEPQSVQYEPLVLPTSGGAE